jgi:hypothetical protein
MRNEDVWEEKGIIPPFIISAQDGEESSASRSPTALPTGEKPPVSVDRTLGGFRIGLDITEKRKISCPSRVSLYDFRTI